MPDCALKTNPYTVCDKADLSKGSVACEGRAITKEKWEKKSKKKKIAVAPAVIKIAGESLRKYHEISLANCCATSKKEGRPPTSGVFLLDLM